MPVQTAVLSVVVLVMLVLGSFPSRADPVPGFAMLPIKMLDTSGEPTDQSAEHAARLSAMAGSLSARLAGGERYRIVGVTAEAMALACPEETPACILAAAEERGASLAFLGVVHKSSTLIMQMFARVVDTATGATLLSRELNFRGDTDESWRRMEDFLVRQIEDHPAMGKSRVTTK